jgi:hypothetical protein
MVEDEFPYTVRTHCFGRKRKAHPRGEMGQRESCFWGRFKILGWYSRYREVTLTIALKRTLPLAS